MKSLFACLLAMLLVAGMASATVEQLTLTSFNKTVSESKFALVKFYAPWCGHCKALKLPYEEVAKRLEGRALIAEVDCTVDKEVCEEYKIKGFPTIHLFKNGVHTRAYDGERNVEAMVDFVLSHEGDAMKTVTTDDELSALKKASKLLCVVKTASSNSTLATLLQQQAETRRAQINFTLVTASNLLPEAAMESLTVYRGNETETYNGDMSSQSINAFIELAEIPYVGEINPTTFRKYMNQATTGWIFLDGNCDASIKDELISVAQKYRNNVVLGWLDSDLYGSVGQQMALPTNVSYPAFVIENARKHYILTETNNTEIDANAIAAFIERYINNEVTPTILSQPVPEVETTEGMTTIVGNTLISYIERSVDLIILFYAPWCGHCKNLLPAYEGLAKSVENSSVIVAKFDVSSNNADSTLFPIEGIPTIYFVPAGGSPILYEGARTAENILSFMQTHATSPVTAVQPEQSDNTTNQTITVTENEEDL